MGSSKFKLSLTLFGLITLGAANLVLGGQASANNELLLWSFGNNYDGAHPFSSLVMDASGNVYGTTAEGGPHSGTAFKISASGEKSVLWNFGNGTDGTAPSGPLLVDHNGNLYGTAGGGTYAGGTVFELAADGSESVLWSFGNGSDGKFPYHSGLVACNNDIGIELACDGALEAHHHMDLLQPSRRIHVDTSFTVTGH